MSSRYLIWFGEEFVWLLYLREPKFAKGHVLSQSVVTQFLPNSHQIIFKEHFSEYLVRHPVFQFFSIVSIYKLDARMLLLLHFMF